MTTGEEEEESRTEREGNLCFSTPRLSPPHTLQGLSKLVYTCFPVSLSFLLTIYPPHFIIKTGIKRDLSQQTGPSLCFSTPSIRLSLLWLGSLSFFLSSSFPGYIGGMYVAEDRWCYCEHILCYIVLLRY